MLSRTHLAVLVGDPNRLCFGRLRFIPSHPHRPLSLSKIRSVQSTFGRSGSPNGVSRACTYPPGTQKLLPPLCTSSRIIFINHLKKGASMICPSRKETPPSKQKKNDDDQVDYSLAVSHFSCWCTE